MRAALKWSDFSGRHIKTYDPRAHRYHRASYAHGQPCREAPAVTLPYFGYSSHKVQWAFNKHNIKVFQTSLDKYWNLTLTTRTDVILIPDRKIPCTCGKVYVGETDRDLPTRLNEHITHGPASDYDQTGIIKHSHEKDYVIKTHYQH